MCDPTYLLYIYNVFLFCKSTYNLTKNNSKLQSPFYMSLLFKVLTLITKKHPQTYLVMKKI